MKSIIFHNFFEIRDGDNILCTVSKFQAFASRFEFEKNLNRTKTFYSDNNSVKYKEFE